MKTYKIIKSGIFPKPYDKEGLKIALNEKAAANFIKKGAIADMNPPKAKETKKPASKAPKKESKKEANK